MKKLLIPIAMGLCFPFIANAGHNVTVCGVQKTAMPIFKLCLNKNCTECTDANRVTTKSTAKMRVVSDTKLYVCVEDQRGSVHYYSKAHFYPVKSGVYGVGRDHHGRYHVSYLKNEYDRCDNNVIYKYRW